MAILNICNNLLGRNLDLPSPLSEKNKTQDEEFNTFFIDEIAMIRENLQYTREEHSLVQRTTYINDICNLDSDQLMKNFKLFNHIDVIKFIRKSPSKSYQLDPIPTDILKDIVVEISPLLIALINCSLGNRVFPDKQKEAFLGLLLKKINLDPIKKNYGLFQTWLLLVNSSNA